jgi:hypothetical protein
MEIAVLVLSAFGWGVLVGFGRKRNKPTREHLLGAVLIEAADSLAFDRKVCGDGVRSTASYTMLMGDDRPLYLALSTHSIREKLLVEPNPGDPS